MGLVPPSSEPSGGSQPDAFARAILDFVETPGAGTYTASIVVPAGALVATWYLLGPPGNAGWAATTAPLRLGDTQTGPTAYINDLDLGAGNYVSLPYDPTNDAVWDGASCFSAAQIAGSGAPGAYTPFAKPAQIIGPLSTQSGVGVPYTSADTITASIVTTGAGGSTGKLQVVVLGFGVPSGIIHAVKS